MHDGAGRDRQWSLGRLPLLLVLLMEAACSTMPRSGGYYEHDGPGRMPLAEVMSVPNAVPKPGPLSAIGNQPYTVFDKTYYPLQSAAGYHARGIASWYGRQFRGKFTSDGERYNMYAMTAAHKTLPLPSYARVTDLSNGRSVIVRVNDRGPFLNNRLIDLSYAAAAKLGMLRSGTALVEVDGIVPGKPPVQTARAQSGSTVEESAGKSAIPDPPLLFLQVGAFASRRNAETLRRRLVRADFRRVRVQRSRSSSNALFLVRIGPLPSVADSDRLARRIAAYGIRNVYVVVE
ncbi:MAG: septal ring lytic transglycosylase RlpA family protein [Acidiferrobacterales bacterium]